ncbi:MAG: DUF5615 family PIN-like protein [Clostridia bacterium]
MQLLFDENLSPRLVTDLADMYPNSIHVRDVGLTGATDAAIWAYARDHRFLIVSKDTDFYQRSVLYGPPPKVVGVRVGNSSTRAIADLLRVAAPVLHRFAADADSGFLPLPLSMDPR